VSGGGENFHPKRFEQGHTDDVLPFVTHLHILEENSFQLETKPAVEIDVVNVDGETYIINAMKNRIHVLHHICDVYDMFYSIKNFSNQKERVRRIISLSNGSGMDMEPLPPIECALKLMKFYGDDVTLKEIAGDLGLSVLRLFKRVTGY